MPTYCYTYLDDSTKSFELYMTWEQKRALEEHFQMCEWHKLTEEQKEFLKGKEPIIHPCNEKICVRDIATEAKGCMNAIHNEEYRSDALGIFPNQVADEMKRLKQHGISGVRFEKTREGLAQCVMSSRADRKKYTKLRGCVDFDGGYGDAT